MTSKKREATKAKPKKRKPGAGRPAMPAELRKVSITVRLPARVRKGYIDRAAARGTDSRGVANSSAALEIERAFYATES